MKRRIIVFIFIGIFNCLLVYGITYANQIMLKNNFIIKLNNSNSSENNDDNSNIPPVESPTIDTEYQGESVSKIAKKLEKYFKKTGLEGYGEHVASSSISKGVNPYLIGGIILVNTNCVNDCSIIFKNCNNVGDVKVAPGFVGGFYKKYDSI